MSKKQHKFLIDTEVLKKYKMLCVELNLVMSSQTEQLIVQFVKVQKENAKIKRELKRLERI